MLFIEFYAWINTYTTAIHVGEDVKITHVLI